MKSCFYTLLVFLLWTTSSDVTAQVTSDLSPCPGFNYELTPGKQTAQEFLEAHFTLLQSDLSPEQKKACQLTQGQSSNLPVRSQADDPLHTITHEHRKNNVWIPSMRDEYLYDANGQVSSFTRNWWDTQTQAFSTPWFRNLYSYDAEGRIIAFTRLSWDEVLLSYVNSFRSTQEWDETGELIQSSGYSWQNEDWLLVSTFNVTMENGLVTETVSKSLSDETGILTNESRVLFEYDDQQRVILQVNELFNPTFALWQASQRTTFIYDGQTQTRR